MQHFPDFPGDCMLLFNAMPMGWVMAWTKKLRKYTHVHNINEGTRFVAEHTNEHESIRHAGLSLTAV